MRVPLIALLLALAASPAIAQIDFAPVDDDGTDPFSTLRSIRFPAATCDPNHEVFFGYRDPKVVLVHSLWIRGTEAGIDPENPRLADLQCPIIETSDISGLHEGAFVEATVHLPAGTSGANAWLCRNAMLSQPDCTPMYSATTTGPGPGLATIRIPYERSPGSYTTLVLSLPHAPNLTECSIEALDTFDCLAALLGYRLAVPN